MYIKVKEKWIYVVDESTNGVEHIYYDEDGNGYYDYEVEEIATNRPLTVKDLNESFEKMYNEQIKYIVRDSGFNTYTWDVVDRVPTASNEMQDVKITTSGGILAQMNSFANTAIISESDLKRIYEPFSKLEPKTRRSKKKKANTQSTNEADTSN